MDDVKLRFLLVDDDADDREFFAEYLEQRPELLVMPPLCSGEELRTVLSELPDSELPGAIVLDQNMPRLSGLETLQYLKSQDRLRHIPVAICSTYVDAALRTKMVEQGAKFVVVKPTSSHDYHRLVDEFLGGGAS